MKVSDSWLGFDLFTRNSGYRSNRIRWYSTHRWEGPTLAAHQGKFIDNETTVEMLGRPIQEYSWCERKREMAESGGEWAVVAPMKAFDNHQRAVFRRLLQAQVELRLKYAWGEIVLQGVDGLIGKVFGRRVIMARRLGNFLKHNAICSKASNYGDVRLGLLPWDAVYWSPDDTWDWKLRAVEWDAPVSWFVVQHSDGWFSPIKEKEKCTPADK